MKVNLVENKNQKLMKLEEDYIDEKKKIQKEQEELKQSQYKNNMELNDLSENAVRALHEFNDDSGIKKCVLRISEVKDEINHLYNQGIISLSEKLENLKKDFDKKVQKIEESKKDDEKE